MKNMNVQQRILLTTYGGGDYAHLITEIDAFAEAAESAAEQADDLIEHACGDTLILFLWRELAKDGDTNHEQYLARLEQAVEEIHTVYNALLDHVEPKNEAVTELEDEPSF